MLQSCMLILTLLYVQQEPGTPVRSERDRYEGFESETLCKAAGAALEKTYDHIATEPTTGYDGEAPQPEKEQFELMRPYVTCIRVR